MIVFPFLGFFRTFFRGLASGIRKIFWTSFRHEPSVDIELKVIQLLVVGADRTQLFGIDAGVSNSVGADAGSTELKLDR